MHRDGWCAIWPFPTSVLWGVALVQQRTDETVTQQPIRHHHPQTQINERSGWYSALPSREEKQHQLAPRWLSRRAVKPMCVSIDRGGCNVSEAGLAEQDSIAALVLLFLTLPRSSHHGWGWLWMGSGEHRWLPGESRVGHSCHGLHRKQMHR